MESFNAENCLNCEKPLVQIEGKRKKQFCNSTCRSNYWQKGKRKEIKDLTKPTNEVKPKVTPKTNFVINTENKNIPPIPTKNEGEDVFDFANRKNEWKRLYG